MSDSTEHDIAGVARAFAMGDNEIVGRALDDLRGYLLVIASRRMSPLLRLGKVAASDMVADTIAVAYAKRASFRGRCEAELRAWLRGILTNRLREERHRLLTRKYCVFKEAPQPSGGAAEGVTDRGPSPSEVVRSEERKQALVTLDEVEREVIRLRVNERLTYPEIGERIGRSHEAARQIWRRACVRLRETLGPNDGP